MTKGAGVRAVAGWGAGALLALLGGCSADASPGPTDAVVEFTVPSGDRYRGEVRVAVHPLVVDGRTMELRVELTPLGGDDQRDAEEISLEQLVDYAPVLSDVRTLTSHQVLGYPKDMRRTDVDETTTVVGEPVVYQAWYAAPDADMETLDLVIHPSWPQVTRVPVVRP